MIGFRTLAVFLTVNTGLCGEMSAEQALDSSAGNREAAAKAEILFIGMRDARDRLRQGVARAKGWEFVPVKGLPPDGSELTFNLSFDNDAGLTRTEKVESRLVTEPLVPGTPPPAQPPEFDPKTARFKRWLTVFITRPHDCIYSDQPAASERPGDIWIVPSDDGKRARISGVFDIRTVCLLHPATLKIKKPFDEAYKEFAEAGASSVTEEPNGLVRIEQIRDGNMARRLLWLDPRRGLSPVRLEMADRRITPIPDKTKWPDPVYVSTAAWVEKNGVWVPAKYRLDNMQRRDKQGRHEYHEFTFEWESVNQPLDKSLFEVGSIQARKGTWVRAIAP